MRAPIEIEVSDDPRIAAFHDIRERDLVRQDTFIAEGTVVVRSLLRSDLFEPRSLLVLRNRLDGLAELLGEVPAHVPVHVAERPVMDSIAGFAMHRGVLALGQRRESDRQSTPERLASIARQGGVVVAAVGIANHDNMGGIFRNATAFGAGMVILDETACDPLYRKAIRVSAGAVLAMPFERVEASELPDLLRAHGFRLRALSPGGSVDVASLETTEPVALLLGAEGEGLPREMMRAGETVRIDMVPGFDSLNVATSAAIALQRLYSARRASAAAPVAVSAGG